MSCASLEMDKYGFWFELSIQCSNQVDFCSCALNHSFIDHNDQHTEMVYCVFCSTSNDALSLAFYNPSCFSSLVGSIKFGPCQIYSELKYLLSNLWLTSTTGKLPQIFCNSWRIGQLRICQWMRSSIQLLPWKWKIAVQCHSPSYKWMEH